MRARGMEQDLLSGLLALPECNRDWQTGQGAGSGTDAAGVGANAGSG